MRARVIGADGGRDRERQRESEREAEKMAVVRQIRDDFQKRER